MTAGDSPGIVGFADQLELRTLQTGRTSTSAAERIAAARGLDEDSVEEIVGRVRTEFRRRSRVDGYPFRVEAGALAADGSAEDQLVYEFLVTLSVVPATRILAGTSYRPTREFERVTREALETYTSGTALVFSELSSGKIRAAIGELGDLLNVEAYPHHARAARKDHGLDVVAWRAFRSQRHGHPTLLCQCTVSESGRRLIGKARETSAQEWARLLDVTEPSLTTALAVPHVMPPDWEYWSDLISNTELILDRLRLWELLTATQRQAFAARPEFVETLNAMRAVG